MSQPPATPVNPLNEVISKINALTRESQLRTQTVDISPRGASVNSAASPEVPVLTEAYELREPLQFIARSDLPTLSSSAAEEALIPGLSADEQTRIMAEMAPLIEAAVKKAMLRELLIMEKALKGKIEQEVMDALRKRIASGQY